MKPVVEKKYQLDLDCFDEGLFLQSLEKTADCVWLSKTQLGQRYTIRGVPAAKVDLVVVPEPDMDAPDRAPDMYPILEISTKRGRYDGAGRRRIMIRWQPIHQIDSLQSVSLSIELYDYAAVSRVVNEEGEIYYQERYPRWRSELDAESDLDGIVRWHFGRYYRFLADFDVRGVCDEFREQICNGSYTLAEANRLASRLLYRAARDLGYRKLTLREQMRLGLSGQWHSESEYATAQQKYSATGQGEFSLTASNRNNETERMIDMLSRYSQS